MDGVHPTHNVQPAYGWIKKGERKEIPANSVGEPGLIFNELWEIRPKIGTDMFVKMLERPVIRLVE